MACIALAWLRTVRINAVNYILCKNSWQLNCIHVFAIFRENTWQFNASFHFCKLSYRILRAGVQPTLNPHAEAVL